MTRTISSTTSPAATGDPEVLEVRHVIERRP